MASTSCERQVDFSTYTQLADDLLVYSGTTGYVNTKYNKTSFAVNENGKKITWNVSDPHTQLLNWILLPPCFNSWKRNTMA